MLATVDAALAELEEEEGVIPDDITMVQLVDGVIRGKYKLGPSQLRVLVAWMPHFAPKLATTTNVTLNYAEALERERLALERCIERSKSPPLLNPPKTIEHEELVSAEELKKPFQRNYRRFTSPR
jgi:hypothetical protein